MGSKETGERKIFYKLRQLRKQKRLSQMQLSELTGIPRSSISEIESGIMIPKQKRLESIAKALGVNVDDLR